MNSDLSILQNSIGYKFKDESLLQHALRHSSFTNEHSLAKKECNERLEFLGDAVLELVSSDFIFIEYPEMPEGKLTRLRASLVCEPSLAFDARAFGLQDFIMLGKGEESTGGRNKDSVIADACEALIGAIYQDGGIEPAREFILKHILNDHTEKQSFKDSKSSLQETSQRLFQKTPVYELTGEEGPAHDKVFTSRVLIGGEVYGTGSGRTKKAAEQNASREALERIKRR